MTAFMATIVGVENDSFRQPESVTRVLKICCIVLIFARRRLPISTQRVKTLVLLSVARSSERCGQTKSNSYTCNHPQKNTFKHAFPELSARVTQTTKKHAARLTRVLEGLTLDVRRSRRGAMSVYFSQKIVLTLACPWHRTQVISEVFKEKCASPSMSTASLTIVSLSTPLSSGIFAEYCRS